MGMSRGLSYLGRGVWDYHISGSFVAILLRNGLAFLYPLFCSPNQIENKRRYRCCMLCMWRKFVSGTFYRVGTHLLHRIFSSFLVVHNRRNMGVCFGFTRDFVAPI